MKKLAMVMVVVVMMVLSVSLAYASAYGDLESYIRENGLTELYSNKVSTDGVFGTIGSLNTKWVEDDFGVTEDWNDVETWFVDWYEKALMEHYPEYGQIGVAMTHAGKYGDTDIWHLTIAAENDLVNYIDGDQCIVDLMIVFD